MIPTWFEFVVVVVVAPCRRWWAPGFLCEIIKVMRATETSISPSIGSYQPQLHSAAHSLLRSSARPLRHLHGDLSPPSSYPSPVEPAVFNPPRIPCEPVPSPGTQTFHPGPTVRSPNHHLHLKKRASDELGLVIASDLTLTLKVRQRLTSSALSSLMKSLAAVVATAVCDVLADGRCVSEWGALSLQREVRVNRGLFEFARGSTTPSYGMSLCCLRRASDGNVRPALWS
jgi:hypothetical protein